MIIIKDYTGGVEKVYGPYKAVNFHCLNQSVPAVNDPTVTFAVSDTEDAYKHITVSLSHTIESIEGGTTHE